MKEILFRGRSIKNRSWVYGYVEIVTFPLDPNRAVMHHFCDWGLNGEEEVDIETIGQWTGEVDKAKNKVFENDILEMDSWSPKLVAVGFVEGAFCLVNKDGEYVGDLHYIHHADRPQATVVGNLTDDTRLLN